MSAISLSNLRIEEVRIDGHSQPVALRSFRPPAQKHPLSIILYFHGGLFTGGSLDDTNAVCETLALHVRSWVLSVGYSLAPAFPFPNAVEDAHRALQWVRSEARRMRADKWQIAVAGHDAGGNIATSLAAIARDRGDAGIRAQVLLAPLLDPSMTRVGRYTTLAAPAIDTLAAGYRAYLPTFSQRIHPYAAPLESCRLAHLPAAFIATVEHDPLHIEAEHYAASLIAAGVPTEYARYANTTRASIATHPPTVLAASGFLQRHLSGR
ncbi:MULTISPECIES: alpha/beta hydrolase [Burkholderia]|uniref:Alpha/beta hydrolase n=1 Tax=Burkholderia ubonensis TaxID=101571 RepID=A0A119UAT7_9BURK|nr:MULTISPECIES: alpha/beta hydrolase [Burkholderia]AJX13033.1 alpha/beta hydrolase fold family protein [Burkholderia ubonensis MSMB22]KIP14709.1 alpha/beta hydrolase fold family protein [Burkholderia sp. MSHR3999]KVD56806.1 alpha/beta hydrolase [Burkholderia ubonensis]KVD73344.1 alpha/beta hydrolase [Burkholderia ubonensis]KVG28242.1 alpha/beta hydrolase [Burkholderia ubonensis]